MANMFVGSHLVFAAAQPKAGYRGVTHAVSPIFLFSKHFLPFYLATRTVQTRAFSKHGELEMFQNTEHKFQSNTVGNVNTLWGDIYGNTIKYPGLTDTTFHSPSTLFSEKKCQQQFNWDAKKFSFLNLKTQTLKSEKKAGTDPNFYLLQKIFAQMEKNFAFFCEMGLFACHHLGRKQLRM